MFHMIIIIKKYDVEMNIFYIILRYRKRKTFIINWRLCCSFDCTSFLKNTLIFIEHINFKIRI